MKRVNWKFLIPSVSTVALACLLLLASFLLIRKESYSNGNLPTGELDGTDSECVDTYGFGPCIMVNTIFYNEDGVLEGDTWIYWHWILINFVFFHIIITIAKYIIYY